MFFVRKAHRRRAARGALLFAVVLVALLAAPGSALRERSALAQRSVIWSAFDVTLDLRRDGSYHVAERQTIDFEGGPFRGGDAAIPLEQIDEISNVLVSEASGGQDEGYEFVSWYDFEDEPGTYSYRETGSDLEITWAFPPTTNRERTFVIEYDVEGALRVYTPDQAENGQNPFCGAPVESCQQILWTAVGEDVTEIAPVERASMTIYLPEAVDPALTHLGPDSDDTPQDHTEDGQTWRWERSGLNQGDEFTVDLEFPTIVEAEPPAWQQADDERALEEERQEEQGAVFGVIFLAIGLLTMVLGGAGVYGLWYVRGRDPHVGAIADFLAEPPDDLPPGAVGALVDEEAHEREIVATLVDLGNRGVIKIDEETSPGGRDYKLTLLKGDPAVTGFERMFLGSLFGGELNEGETEQLSKVNPLFSRQSEAIKDEMFAELVRRGYFTASPEATRDRWRRGAIILLAAVALFGCVFGVALATISAWVWLPIVALALVAAALIWLSKDLPRKTQAGAETAAKWRAFRTYLSDIGKYDRVAESKAIFERYLPYAIAFGLGESWVHTFAGVRPPLPEWFGPGGGTIGPMDWGPDPWTRGQRRRGGTVIIGPGWGGPSGGGFGGSGGGGFGGSSGGGGFDFPGLPDLQDMSNRGGRGLQSGSDSFFDMLTTAAGAFGSFSGGGGGGGRSRGFGGGGRSSRRSSGGGRRGFR